jgi:ribonuclease P protein component
MRRSAEFSATVRGGRRGSSRALMVHVAVAASGTSPRVGFVVGRGVGPAVVRNRVRRRLRHLVRARLTRLPAGAAVVVRAHPVTARMSSAQLGTELDAALAKAIR